MHRWDVHRWDMQTFNELRGIMYIRTQLGSVSMTVHTVHIYRRLFFYVYIQEAILLCIYTGGYSSMYYTVDYVSSIG